MTQPAFPKPVTVRKPPRPLRRRTPMRRSNPGRKAEKYERNFGERGATVREMPCLLLGRVDECARPIEAAHASARGMGGVKGDRRQLVPLCGRHHSISGRMAPSDFTARYQINLRHEADRIARELDVRGIP